MPYGCATLTFVYAALGSALGAAEEDAIGAGAFFFEGRPCGGVTGTRTAGGGLETGGGATEESNAGAVVELAAVAEEVAFGG